MWLLQLPQNAAVKVSLSCREPFTVTSAVPNYRMQRQHSNVAMRGFGDQLLDYITGTALDSSKRDVMIMD